MKDKAIKETVSIVCATILSAYLLYTDGSIAIGVALALIGSFTGISGFVLARKLNNG